MSGTAEQGESGREANLAVQISGLRFKNPVLTASGTFGYGLEFTPFFDLSELGGFCTKGLSFEPMRGAPPGRIVETPAGMLNAIGLENVGTAGFIEEKLPQLERYDTHIIVNAFGKTIDEFVAIVDRLNPCAKVSAYELNISCPNIKEGGIHFGHDPDMTFRVVEAVKKKSAKPLWVKLSPNVTNISVFARACEDGGADAISLVNTLLGISVDVNKFRSLLSNVTGGLSGPAIRPIAVRLVYEVVQAVKIPVVGIGGITNARDALEFMIAGARAVQIGTANFFDPMVSIKVIRGLRQFCQERGIQDINEIIGKLHGKEIFSHA